MIKDIGDYFDGLVERYGGSIMALDYTSLDRQLLRFDMVAEAVDDIEGKSVLDIGSGFGDLGAFLRGKFGKLFSYTCVEVSEKMTKQALELRPELFIENAMWPATKLSKKQFDLVVMCGVLYLYPFTKAAELIDAAWNATKGVLVFDCQSMMSDHREGKDEYHYEPQKVLFWLLTYSPYVVLRHDRSRNFFMIYVYREESN